MEAWERASLFFPSVSTALPKGLKCFIPTCSNVLLKGFQISAQKPSPLCPSTKVFHPNVFRCFVQRFSDFRSKAFTALPKGLRCFIPTCSNVLSKGFLVSAQKPSLLRPKPRIVSSKVLLCFVQKSSFFWLEASSASPGSLRRVVQKSFPLRLMV